MRALEHFEIREYSWSTEHDFKKPAWRHLSWRMGFEYLWGNDFSAGICTNRADLELYLRSFDNSDSRRAIAYIPHDALNDKKLLWREVCDQYDLEYPSLSYKNKPVGLDDMKSAPVVAFVFDKIEKIENQPELTILIPHWESFGFLRMCLWSIRQHLSAQEIAIVVLDDESSPATYEKIEKLCVEHSAELHKISRFNKKTVADVGLLLDLGLDFVKTKFVCMLDADTIHLSPNVYKEITPLLQKRSVVSIGLDTGLGSSYHSEKAWKRVKRIYPYDVSYPGSQTITNNLFRVMRTADANAVSKASKFSRQVEKRKLRDQSGRVLRRLASISDSKTLQNRIKSLLLFRLFNSHYPSMPPTGDNGVTANYWMESNNMGRKINIPITSYGFQSPSDGICFQNISDLIVHIALSTRALSEERREIRDAGGDFYEAVRDIIAAKNPEQEIYNEVIARSKSVDVNLS